MLIHELETPVPVVDLARLRANLDRMATYTEGHGIALRPHVKTHKTPWIGREQLARGAVGLTCATPHEVAVMGDVATDLLLAYPPIGAARRARLFAVDPAVQLTVQLDSMEAIDALAADASTHDRRVRVYVELDVGMHRVGVPDVAQAIALARRVESHTALEYTGIAFYPGHLRGHALGPGLATLSATLDGAIATMDAAGVRPRVVSGGSTPTGWQTHQLRAVTEMRPGTYVYNDRDQVAAGSAAWEECAFTVAATVVSTSVTGQAVVDAGTKALGREPLRGDDGTGFGALLEHPAVTVSRMSEEHGILDLGDSAWRPTVGEVIRIVPNHVCIVTHLNDVIYGVEGEQVVTNWSVAARGRGLDLLRP
jgi:D-serine deaminase-like pyridoxal phosphate-dependent protein